MSKYEVKIGDVAEMEIQDTYFWYLRRSPDAAHRWILGLQKAFESLSFMPARCPVVGNGGKSAKLQMRKHLYGKYKILFHVVEPDYGDAGFVHVIRVVHGARSVL